jgi:DNA primase
LGRALDPTIAVAHGVRELADPIGTWNALLKEFGPETVRGAGLMAGNNAFLFARHRLLFFYRDGGRPVFVQARDVTGTAEPKELRPKSLACPVPFNRDALTGGPDRVYVCEGCVDTLSAVQLGLPAVGVPGVQAFRDEWIPLFPAGAHVVVAFDDDEAGRRQGPALRDRLRARGLRADAVHPDRPGCKDVNDLLKTLTPDTTP